MFHKGVLISHSLLRWILLLLLVARLYQSYSGWFGKKEWTETESKFSLWTMMAAHIQLVLGLALYFISPFMKTMFSVKPLMKNAVARFWVVEHLSMMLIAIVLITLGHSLPKRADDSLSKHKKAALFLTFGLLAVFAAIPWPFRKNIARNLFYFF